MIRFIISFIACTIIGNIIGTIGRNNNWEFIPSFLLSIFACFVFLFIFNITMYISEQQDKEDEK